MLILTDTQQVTLSVAFTDKKGNPAEVDGAPVWAVSDANLATVEATDATGMSALVKAVGPLGTVQVSVTADALIGEGTENITGVLDIEIRGSKAVSANVTAGTPEEQP